MTKKQSNKNQSKKKHSNTIFHIGFYQQLFVFLALFIILLGTSIFFLHHSFSITKEQKFHYKENSNIDYKVYLKENDFYETPYLEKNMSYIANLINTITADFNYDFSIDEKTNVTFIYNIIGILTITDSNGNNIYFEKEYPLLENKVKHMENNQECHIKENIDIDYNYYNDLANRFQNTYGIDTTNNFKIYLKISYQNEDLKIPINGKNDMNFNIPLSEKAVTVNLNYKDIANYEEISRPFSIKIKNPLYLLIGLTILLGSIIALIIFIKLVLTTKKKKTPYDKYIQRLLIEYDRVIVECSYLPDLNQNNIIKIESFNELLDVRDNLKLPIMYYNVKEHKKCHFFIKNNTDIFVTTITDTDLERK